MDRNKMHGNITQGDLDRAQRTMGMPAMSPAELQELMEYYRAEAALFATRVVHLAAKQILAAKLRVGPRS